MENKKVISFCLWGDNPKYTVGAIRNAELARKIYPGWVCRFYIGKSTPFKVTEQLIQTTKHWVRATKMSDGWLGMCGGSFQTPELEIYHVEDCDDWRLMLTRFEAIEDPDVEVMISRDCDSRLSKREKEAVDEWLASDKGFHTMHDHPFHTVPILGGMWGIKKGVFSELGRHAREWASKCHAEWQCDQDFLTSVVWPVVQHDRMNHDSFFSELWGGIPFPSRRVDNEFVGQVFDENEVTVEEHVSALVKHLKMKGGLIRRPEWI